MGPRPMISGSMAVTALATMRASGAMPSAFARSLLITTTAAAPSLSGQALPAVMRPSSRKAGLSLPSASAVVPRRGPSSVATATPDGVVTGVISRAKKPSSCDATARCCESAEKASMSARETSSCTATRSAVSPMGM